MPVPPDPVLLAAVRWVEKLPANGRARCRALFTTHAEYSDISPTQYDAAYRWLEETGLLDGSEGALPVGQRVFRAALLTGDVYWFADADLHVREPTELPIDAGRAAAALGLSELEAYQEIHAVRGKVDAAERLRIGTAGETALIELLSSSTSAGIQHVAAHSDGYGYDIAVHAGQHSLHIEAKSTTRRNRLMFFLSRREYEVMRYDPSWQLVILQLTEQLAIAAIGSVSSTWIETQLPDDQGSYGRWDTCRIDVPPEQVTRGIPRLAPVLREGSAALLRE
ncbi:protein NO VEIN domain-containing protein [Actinomadura gamaensis]|uniref:Protein NO VEIN domain-containing protein n=1 Tax=Actinomadura gamaensis TaxID=1763541 RepID=A0ABV9UBJ7_9ACTN